jgi:hypothetical protein
MRSTEAALGRGVGAQRPVLRGNELKKTGARSARAGTRGQNPLVNYNLLQHYIISITTLIVYFTQTFPSLPLLSLMLLFLLLLLLF